jgi:hypothetical protein
MGENDLKFTRWAQMFGDSIAHSIDGDYLLISLLEHEKQMAFDAVPTQIAIYRLEVTVDCVTKKRKSTEEAVKKERKYEYVSIPRLYNDIHSYMEGLSTKPWANKTSHGKHYMKILAVLVGFGGTDFTRSLPQIGVQWLMDALENGRIWYSLLGSFNLETECLDVQKTCDGFVANLYRHKFAKHVSIHATTLQEILNSLQRPQCKLSQRTKKNLPSCAQIVATVKNINFVLDYWKCRQPVQSTDEVTWDNSSCFADYLQYGFKLGRGGAVQYEDV